MAYKFVDESLKFWITKGTTLQIGLGAKFIQLRRLD